MAMMSPSRIWQVYNSVLLDGGLEPLPEGSYASNRKHLQAFAEWCDRRGIDPERWIRAKHAAIKWRFRVRISQLARATPKFLAAFRDWGDGVAAEHIHQAELRLQVVDDRWGGLRVMSERLKRTLEPRLCRIAPETAYHPGSRWCAACPESRACHVGR